MDSDFLYNVNVVRVNPGFEKQYIAFFEAFNQELLRKYPKYYKGAQLYQDKTITNSFTVIAPYYNVSGVTRASAKISNLAQIRYAKLGNNVVRTTIVSFRTATRVVKRCK